MGCLRAVARQAHERLARLCASKHAIFYISTAQELVGFVLLLLVSGLTLGAIMSTIYRHTPYSWFSAGMENTEYPAKIEQMMRSIEADIPQNLASTSLSAEALAYAAARDRIAPTSRTSELQSLYAHFPPQLSSPPPSDDAPLKKYCIVTFSIKRPATEYLSQHLTSMLSTVRRSRFAKDVHWAIFNGQLPPEGHTLARWWSKVVPLVEYNVGESDEILAEVRRMGWLRKGIMDYAGALHYCANKGRFTIVMEDDIIAKVPVDGGKPATLDPNWPFPFRKIFPSWLDHVDAITRTLEAQPNENWLHVYLMSTEKFMGFGAHDTPWMVLLSIVASLVWVWITVTYIVGFSEAESRKGSGTWQARSTRRRWCGCRALRPFRAGLSLVASIIPSRVAEPSYNEVSDIDMSTFDSENPEASSFRRSHSHDGRSQSLAVPFSSSASSNATRRHMIYKAVFALILFVYIFLILLLVPLSINRQNLPFVRYDAFWQMGLQKNREGYCCTEAVLYRAEVGEEVSRQMMNYTLDPATRAAEAARKEVTPVDVFLNTVVMPRSGKSFYGYQPSVFQHVGFRSSNRDRAPRYTISTTFFDD
ncbi:hypothetical protein HK102_009974 [Quaeritorhiza haematococci]|nr:hypothetical protein HK102_009974 [Quaeritorhiza haematococci]